MVDGAITTPINKDINILIGKIIDEFVGDEKVYYSKDYLLDDTQHLDLNEFLNSLSFRGLPPHALRSKVGAPVMLLQKKMQVMAYIIEQGTLSSFEGAYD